MHELDLTSLRLFAAVCETRNIARAAEQHHIVASAVSKRAWRNSKAWSASPCSSGAGAA